MAERLNALVLKTSVVKYPPGVQIPLDPLGENMNLPKEMANRGLVVSCSQARRYIAMGAVQLNGEIVSELDAEASPKDTIRVGKKTVSYGSASRLATAPRSNRDECKSLGGSTPSASAGENDDTDAR